MSIINNILSKLWLKRRQAVKILLLLIVVNTRFISNVQANANTGSNIDSIVSTLSNLTCETQGIGDLLRSEFAHTCIPDPVLTFLIANIVSPGLYANTMLHLKINDPNLIIPSSLGDPNTFVNTCLRQNRIDPNNRVISFGLCSNTLLATARAGAIGNLVLTIAKGLAGVEDLSTIWDDIKNVWNIPEYSYHNVYMNQADGSQGTMFDIGIIPVIPWKVITINDRMCVATTGFSGWIPVGCKYIKEPFPQSVYSSFMDNYNAPNSTYSNSQMLLTKCSSVGGCYQRAYNYSRTGIVMTAPLIECIREMTARLMVSQEVCTFEDVNSLVNSAAKGSSVLFQFQSSMKRAVTALLTIYVILFGIKILLSGDVPPKGEIITFILKIIFVTYFSVGISVSSGGSSYNKLDGLIQWVLPFLINGISAMANWVMSSSPSGLCSFSPSEYPANLGHLSLWDSLDCRISHYLGLDAISTMIVQNQQMNHDFANFDFFNFSIPPIFFLLIPAVMTGNLTLVSLALMFPLLIISVGAYMLSSVVTCIIAIVILVVLAPIFVPMFLFGYTRSYFDSWVKLLLSFMLQPMVVTTFMVVMFSVFDYGFYGACKYNSVTMTSNQRQTKLFYIDNNWNGYSASDASSCQNSLGYMLNNPIAALYDFTKTDINSAATTQPGSLGTSSYMSMFGFLGSIVSFTGEFFTSPQIIFAKIKDFILALITACFTLYLMYHFSEQLSNFAADMTEGISLSSTTIKPQSLFKAGMAALSAAKNLKGGATAAGPRAGDKIAGAGAGRAEDRVSTGAEKEEAKDSISTGGDGSSVRRRGGTVTTGPAAADLPEGENRGKSADLISSPGSTPDEAAGIKSSEGSGSKAIDSRPKFEKPSASTPKAPEEANAEPSKAQRTEIIKTPEAPKNEPPKDPTLDKGDNDA